MNNLRILHLNDLHSHFEQFPVIERFFAEQSENRNNVLRFDLGDNVDRMHPLSEATAGKINVELMNRLDLTAATIGNNEGLGLTHEMLEHLYDEANFDVLLSNLTTNFGQEPKIITTDFGLRVGIIGLTAPYQLAYPKAGWELQNPFDVLDEILPLDCDFTILLSHLGKPTDEKIAEKYDIDLIIGAHTHHLFEHGAQINTTLLAAAGRYGDHVGQIDLTFDENHQLVDAEIEAIPTNTLARRKSDNVFIESLKRRGHEQLQATEIVKLPYAIANVYPNYSASQFLAEQFANFAEVPAMVMNSGLLVTEVLPSKLTLDELHEFLPHSIRLVKLTVSGVELQTILMEMIDVSATLSGQQIRGMGFRGKIFGHLILHGVKFDNGQFYYGENPVKSDEIYELIVPDQYLFAYYFPHIKRVKSEIIFPYFLREIAAIQLSKGV